MAFKFLTFCALVAVARAGVISAPLAYAAPVATKTVAYAAPAQLAYAAPVHKTVVADEYDPNPQYSFSYGISDALTGDSKSQQESRNGDVVQGSYSLVDADGFKRTVDYTADPHNGFNAVVHREPLGKAVVAAPVTKVVATAPVAYAAAPVAYAAPVAKTYVSQPLATKVYAAPALTKTVVSQPALAYATPVAHAAPAYAYHH